jgi:HlyD family secretion protein
MRWGVVYKHLRQHRAPDLRALSRLPAFMHRDPHQPRQRTARQLPPRRSFLARNWIGLGLSLVLLAAGGGYYYYTYETVASAEVAVVQRGSALAAVYGTVAVEPVNEVIVRTRNFGLLSAIKIKEGDAVKEGQVLAEMTDDSIQRQLDSVNAQFTQAKLRQSLGPSSVAQLKNQEIEVDKLKKLVDANNIAPVEYEKALNQLTQVKEQVQNETISLNNEVESLDRARAGIQDQLNQLQLISPMDGIILNLYSNLGEFVPPQTQFCRIGSASNQIVANVNEEDVGYLQPGMKAQIRLYAHQDKDLVGTLKEILPQAENQVYRVLFSLEDPPQTLLPGMTGEMNVIIGEHKNTFTIPSRAVRKGGFVLAVINGRVEEVHVQTGFRTLEKTEILQGLGEGTSVILSNQDLYKPGVRVRELVTKTN